MRFIQWLVGLGLIARGASAGVISDAEIRRILVDFIDRDQQSVGIVAGVIEPSGRRVVAHGTLATGDNRAVDGDTIFEIGSTTKVFTSLLLADMVRRGEVTLTDPVSKYLPAEVRVPERAGRKITLEQLATHTSGLPRLPSNFAPKDETNPYADYTVENLYEFLGTHQLSRDIGSLYEYSNLGAGLLGHALARRAGKDFETLLRERIFQPLGMKSTSIVLSKEMRERLAIGHNEQLKPVPNWDLPTLAGAGALRSTVNDLLIFLSAVLGYARSPLSDAMTSMIAVRKPTDVPRLDIALGWHISKIDGREIVWQNGGTGGYCSWFGYDPKARTGVVALANTGGSETGVDDIGMRLLVPIKQRKQVAIDARLLDRYVGRYEVVPSFVLTVTRDEKQLYVQATGQPKFEVYPESDHKFFFKAFDAQITFVADDRGRAVSLVLHQDGQDIPAGRQKAEGRRQK